MNENLLKNKFKNSLKRGTGQAILILKDNPNLDLSNFIIKASINNLAYDPQCEGSRDEYIYELIKLSSSYEKIESELLKNLTESKDENWGIFQLFKIVKLFAKDGSLKARDAIYERYKKNLDEDFPNIDTFVPIDIDGFEGLKFIAEIQGMILFTYGEKKYYDDYIISYAKELYPHINFEEKLEVESNKNKYIKLFLKSIKKPKKSSATKIDKKYSYKSIKQLIEKGITFPLYKVRRLQNKDLIKFANDLKDEKNEEKIIKYLEIFSRVKYPLELNNLFKFSESNNKEIISELIKCLRFFSDTKIRDLALNKLNSNNFEYYHLGLLIENYHENDYELVTKILKSTRNKDKFHSLGLSVLSIFEKNKTQNCIEPLKVIYDKSNCGSCRYNAINIMIDNKVLPKYIIKEAIYDSNFEIRDLIKELTKT